MNCFDYFVSHLESHTYNKLIFIDGKYKFVITPNNFQITKNNMILDYILSKYNKQFDDINTKDDLWIYKLISNNKSFFKKFGGVYVSKANNEEYFYDFNNSDFFPIDT